jgi:predicted ester cyclase
MRKLLTFLALAALAACIFPSCKNTGSGTSPSGSDSTAAVMKKNIQTALTADSVLMKHDIDGYFKLCAQGYTELGTMGDKPEKNIDSIKAEMKTFFGAYPDFKGEDLKAYTGTDDVLVTGTFSGTFKNPFMKMKPTGKAFKVFDADIYTFDKDGKITSHKSIVPSSIYMSQAGVVLPDKK